MFHPKANPARILIIDDDDLVRGAVQKLLTRAGYDVRTAASALDGLETARVFPPDVILLDLQMPYVGGAEALDVLRVDPASRNAMIVAFSAFIDPQDVARLRRLGFDGLVQKGEEPAEMVRKVAQQVHTRALNSAR